MDVGERIEALSQVASSLRSLHSRGFVFGDLRAPNLMVRVNRAGYDSDNRIAVQDRVTVKLVDFEFCCRAGQPWPKVMYNTDLQYPKVLLDAMADSTKEWPTMEVCHDWEMLRSLSDWIISIMPSL
ncbi:hypothetical protein KIPB_012513 [Kipferlia bialata]|uniref:Protein kinase domain-containing protein n=1 Tax=Kipferlia bialata TaxID=797122 RepID=A0A391NVA3_9EUKA|nr:hypothetical protein KIPB_012513 [Kipferlia bialata]|eukprot:g12513.t1